LLLNPDTIVRPGSLAALVRALEEDDVGAAGGLLLREDGEADRGFAVRRFPTPLRMAAEILLLNRFWPSNPLNRSYRCLDLVYCKKQEVDQPAGACLAVKREASESVGGFDEGFCLVRGRGFLPAAANPGLEDPLLSRGRLRPSWRAQRESTFFARAPVALVLQPAASFSQAFQSANGG
jgi:hypothetical protein